MNELHSCQCMHFTKSLHYSWKWMGKLMGGNSPLNLVRIDHTLSRKVWWKVRIEEIKNRCLTEGGVAFKISFKTRGRLHLHLLGS